MNEWDLKSFDWPMLRPESVVVECGAFHGRWALKIMQRYNPTLHMFEPQAWLTEELKGTFKGWQKAHVHPYGLGTENKVSTLWEVGNDGATFVASADARDAGQPAELREIGQVFSDLGLTAIDLMLINIEGYEFQLIPHMLSGGLWPKWLMFQTHLKFGDTPALFEAVGKFYRNLWDYGSILSAWERREPNP